MNLYQNYLLFILFFCCTWTSYGQEIHLSLDNVPLQEVIDSLENKYNYLFSYKQSDIEGITVARTEASTLNLFLTNVLQGTNIQFEILEKNYVVLTQKSKEDSENLVYLCGKIIDEVNGDPFAYANVFLLNTNKGTVTDADGNFYFHVAISPNDIIEISYVGFKSKQIKASKFLAQPCTKVTLHIESYDYSEVVVTTYLSDGFKKSSDSEAVNLSPNILGALPGQAEPDVLNSIQFLPGISSPNASAESISIRGGTSDQNLILWEDIPIYHSAHYFGLISAFNPYIMKTASVFRGGFNARYGGRVSGLIDLKSPTEGAKKYNAGVNYVNAYANANIPFAAGKGNLLLSTRRSFSELWRSPTFTNLTRRIHQGVLLQIPIKDKLPKGIQITDDFNFLDANVKVSYQITNKDQISLAGFYGNNNFAARVEDNNVRREQIDSLYLKNMGGSLTWKREWNQGFSTQLQAVNSFYRYDYDYQLLTDSRRVPDKVGLKSSEITEQQIHLSSSYQTENRQVFKVGYQLTDYAVNYDITKQLRGNNQEQSGQDRTANLHVLYGTFKSSASRNLGIEGGLRYSYFDAEEQAYLEPRVRLWYNQYEGNNAYRWHINVGKYQQFLSQLIQIEGDQSSIQTPVWVLAGRREIPILNAWQYQVGGTWENNPWLVDAQVYYKKIDGLTSLATGFGDDVANRYHLGEANIQGIDLLIKRRWKNYQTWLSYSLNKVNYHFPQFFDTDFVGPTDQPHALHWVHLWQIGDFEFSLGWKLTSGTPYSNQDFFSIRANDMGNGGMNMPTEFSLRPTTKEFNSERLPMLHQMDASVVYTYRPLTFTYKWKLVTGLSIFNLYNQTNFYSRGFFIDQKPNEMPTLLYVDRANLPFTPNVMVRVEW